MFITSRNDSVLTVSTRIQAQGYFYTKTHILSALVPKPQTSHSLVSLMQIKKNDLFSFTLFLFKILYLIGGLVSDTVAR